MAQEFTDALAMFRAAAARAPDAPCVLYFDARLSYAEVDELSDALAAELLAQGFAAGDRFAIYLQNVPQFPIAVLAAWKAGGIAVVINPMNRARELRLLLDDATPKALICHGSLHEDVVRALPAGCHRPAIRITTSAGEFQTRNDPRLFAGIRPRRFPETLDLQTILAARAGTRPQAAPRYGPADIAFLVYTSGTTGVPKGAMNTHGNVTFNARTYREWMRLPEGGPILAVAPLFHITGLIGHLAAAFITASPMILGFRFEPGVVLDAIAEHRPVFTVGSITVFIALMNHAGARADSLGTLETIYSGGAPIPPSVVSAFRAKFGRYIHNAYGLTESNSPVHAVPLGAEAPVDPRSGALSIGRAVPGAHVQIHDDSGAELPAGEIGEIVVRGPMIVPGYWNKPAETALAMAGGAFRTGDVGFQDEAGWFYLVDRKKDMINAGGYKVWPREVEDVLYTHPAVREAGVVGIPDAYRGETVKAVISLKAGLAATPEEIVAFCKARMAAYKYPRLVEIRDELPKTPTGKILRRALRG